MKYSKKDQLLCFTLDEIRDLFKEEKLKQMRKRIDSGEFSIFDLYDPQKMQEIATLMSDSIGKSKEEVELFCAAYLFEEFHDGDPYVCFIMSDSFNPTRYPQINFEILKRETKENNLSDFLFFNGEHVRAIQLKQYRGTLNTKDLSDFIIKKVRHYGNDLGQVNLLVLLQSPNGNIGDLNFDNLTQNLLDEGLTFEGEVLLSYNLANESRVISRIYPEVAHKVTPIEAFNGTE